MTEIWIEVTPAAQGWAITRRINKDHWPNGVVDTETVATYTWKRQARLVAIFLAHYELRHLAAGESVELLIKDRQGRIKEKNTYGYDPEETKG